MSDNRKQRFEKAATEKSPTLLREYLRFLSQNKKYWMTPIIIILLLIGLLVILSGSVAGTFIYPIF